MLHYLFIFSAFLASITSITQDPIERLGVPGPLDFHKTSYSLAWSSKPNDFYFIQEYLPKGEESAHFNQMLNIDLLVKDISVNDAVEKKVEELDARKKSDPLCQDEVTTSPDGSESIVDFVMSEHKGEELTVMEFNVYRYRQVDLGNKKKGLLFFAYSKRAYGDDITPLLKNLSSVRQEFINAMILSEMPSIHLIDK